MGHHNDLTAVTRSRRITTFFIDFRPIESIIRMGGFYFSGFLRKGGILPCANERDLSR